MTRRNLMTTEAQDNPSRARLIAQDEACYAEQNQRAAVLRYPPRWITIAITSACNYRCTFCSYHSPDGKDVSKVANVPFMMRPDEFRRIVDLAWAGRVPKIHICGTGEPFLNKNILEMVDYTAEVYGEVSVQSNFFRQVFEKNRYLQELVARKDIISYITTDFLSGDPAQHEVLKDGSSYYDVMHALEYISQRTDIMLDVHFLLTRLNYATLPVLLEDMIERGIRNLRLCVVNLFSYDFNAFTASDNVYVSGDHHVTKVLEQVRHTAAEHGVDLFLPMPADQWHTGCDVFWQKIQIWPVQGNDPKRIKENTVPHACRAVVSGDLSSLGYLFDFDDIMAFWNNPRLVNIRQNLLENQYPDQECRHCYCYQNTDGYFQSPQKPLVQVGT